MVDAQRFAAARVVKVRLIEEANKALAECVNGALEELERLQKVNKEIARAAEVMAQISKTLE